MMFFPRKFLTKKDGDLIIKSIKNAELKTSGEIRVHFQRRLKGDLMDEATRIFYKLKMNETVARNGVLIFIAPAKKKFYILGDSGIDAAVPDDFWEEMKNRLSEQLQANNIADGICECVDTIGEKLKTHFPIQSDDKNELPDTISFG